MNIWILDIRHSFLESITNELRFFSQRKKNSHVLFGIVNTILIIEAENYTNKKLTRQKLQVSHQKMWCMCVYSISK